MLMETNKEKFREIRLDGCEGILIDINGIFYDVKTIKPLNLGFAWDLSKNLNNQSKPTIDFLTDIICKKDESE